MKPIDDRNLGGTVKMEAFFNIKELDSFRDKTNRKSIKQTLGLDTWESKHLFQRLTAGMIQRGRGYVCVDWSQEEYEPLVSHGWGKMECVSNKVLPKGKYWSSCSGTQDVFLGIFWAILINHGQEIWIQTWMSSQDHLRNRELPVQVEM